MVSTNPNDVKHFKKIEINQIELDLHEALELLGAAGPNPLLINSDEYWDRYYKLTDKYYPESKMSSEQKQVPPRIFLTLKDNGEPTHIALFEEDKSKKQEIYITLKECSDTLWKKDEEHTRTVAALEVKWKEEVFRQQDIASGLEAKVIELEAEKMELKTQHYFSQESDQCKIHKLESALAEAQAALEAVRKQNCLPMDKTSENTLKICDIALKELGGYIPHKEVKKFINEVSNKECRNEENI